MMRCNFAFSNLCCKLIIFNTKLLLCITVLIRNNYVGTGISKNKIGPFNIQNVSILNYRLRTNEINIYGNCSHI